MPRAGSVTLCVRAAVFYSLSTPGAGDLIRLRDDRRAEVVYQVTVNQITDANDPATVQTMYPTDYVDHP